MIMNLPVELLQDPEYKKIIDRFNDLRERQLARGFQIDRLGTGSFLYAVSNAALLNISKTGALKRYADFLQYKINNYLIRKGKLAKSKFGTVWTCDVVKPHTLPYPVRRVEYPWAILNGDLKNRPMKILDVGSSISLFPIYLSLQGHEVFSIDAEDVLMERLAPNLAKWVKAKVRYSVGDAAKLEFEDNTFDRVFCISVLEHLEEEIIDGAYVNYHKHNLDVKAIEEMLRVLKPNGLLILTLDWSENLHEKRSYKIQDICERLLKPFRPLLIDDKKPVINWEELKKQHIEAWKSFPPYDYVTEGWAIGVILQKK